jgi:Sof1-like domain
MHKLEKCLGKLPRDATSRSFDGLTTCCYRSRHIPKPVYQASKLKRTMLDSHRVKDERRRKHTRAGESKPKAERKKVVIAEQK